MIYDADLGTLTLHNARLIPAIGGKNSVDVYKGLLVDSGYAGENAFGVTKQVKLMEDDEIHIAAEVTVEDVVIKMSPEVAIRQDLSDIAVVRGLDLLRPMLSSRDGFVGATMDEPTDFSHYEITISAPITCQIVYNIKTGKRY